MNNFKQSYTIKTADLIKEYERFEDVFKKINFSFLKQIEKNLTKENIQETKIKFNDVFEIFRSKEKECWEKEIKLEKYMKEIGYKIEEILRVNVINKPQPIINMIFSDELCNMIEKTFKDLEIFYKNPILNYFHHIKYWDPLYNIKATENNFLNKSKTFNFKEPFNSSWKLTKYKLNLEKIVVLIVLDDRLKINDNIKCFSSKDKKNDKNITQKNPYKIWGKVQIDGNFDKEPSYRFFAIKS